MKLRSSFVTGSLLFFVAPLAFAQNAPAVQPTEAAPEAPAPTAASLETSPATPAATSAEPSAPAVVAPAEAAPVEKSGASVVAPAEKLPTAGFDHGFFVQSEDGKFKWVMGARVQVRYDLLSKEDPTSGESDVTSQFSLPRVRLHGKGHLFSKDVTYRWQIEFGKGYVALRDAYLNFKLGEQFQLRAGQDTKPFSREQMTSGFRQQLVDRSIVDTKMGNVGGGDGGTGRDIGLLLHNGYDKAVGFEYELGVYNGTGINPWLPAGALVADPVTGAVTKPPAASFSTTVPGKFSPQVVARVGYNNGIKGYSYSDLEGGGFRYGVAAGGMSDFDFDGDGASRLRANVDGIIKVHGFSAVVAGYIGSAQNGADWGTRRPELLAATVQAGYVIGGLVEPALRWATIGQDDAAGITTTENDFTLGLNVFLEGHDLKWANDFTVAQTDVEASPALSTTNYEFRSQVQFQF